MSASRPPPDQATYTSTDCLTSKLDAARRQFKRPPRIAAAVERRFRRLVLVSGRVRETEVSIDHGALCADWDGPHGWASLSVDNKRPPALLHSDPDRIARMVDDPSLGDMARIVGALYGGPPACP